MAPANEVAEEVIFSYRRIRADGVGSAVMGYRIGRIEYLAEISTDLLDWMTGPDYLEQVGAPLNNGDGSETVLLRPRDTGAAALFFRVRIRED